MKRFLFIYGELNGGGAERVLLDVLRNFDYSSYQVDLLQINAGGVLADELPKEVNVLKAWIGYPLSYRVALRFSLWLGYHGFLRNQLLKTIGAKYYDVAISFLEGMPLKCHSLMMGLAKHNYSWVHCDLEKFHYTAPLFRGKEEVEAYQKMDSVLCVSKSSAEAFGRQFPACKDKAQVIYNPIDTSKIERMTIETIVENPCFTIVVCGRLTLPKRIDRVLRLAQRLKAHSIRAKIQLVGDGELAGQMRQMAEKLDVLDVVDFIGFTRNPFPYIKASQLLLSTSSAEGFSLVICEAMTLGVPVVSTKTAGPMEILGNSKYGLLCDHDDDSIFEAVSQMIRDEKLRARYSQLGRERVNLFSVEKILEDIYKL